jgi:hypothetical protein
MTGTGGAFGFGGRTLDAGIPGEDVVVVPPGRGVEVVVASCAWHIMKRVNEVTSANLVLG